MRPRKVIYIPASPGECAAEGCNERPEFNVRVEWERITNPVKPKSMHINAHVCAAHAALCCDGYDRREVTAL